MTAAKSVLFHCIARYGGNHRPVLRKAATEMVHLSSMLAGAAHELRYALCIVCIADEEVIWRTIALDTRGKAFVMSLSPYSMA